METTAPWKIEDLVWNYLAYHTSSNVGMGLCLQRISPTTYTHTMQEVKDRMTQMHTLRLTKQRGHR